MERWNTLLGTIPDNGTNDALRLPHGHYTVSAEIDGVATDLKLLQQAAQMAARTKHTGWTPWWWPTREGIKPYVHGNAIECSIGAQDRQVTAEHADFWRISPRGQLFIIRGYAEDSERIQVAPGTVLDLTLPVWRVGECLLYIVRLATALGADHTTIAIRCHWTGLRGRRLVAIDGRRAMFEDRVARSNECITSIGTPANRIAAALPEIVRELVEPLFVLFDFFRPGDDFYTVELDRLQQGRF
jgi:hypothetical protein